MACCNGIWYLIERFVFYKECFNKVGLQSVLEGKFEKGIIDRQEIDDTKIECSLSMYQILKESGKIMRENVSGP